MSDLATDPRHWPELGAPGAGGRPWKAGSTPGWPRPTRPTPCCRRCPTSWWPPSTADELHRLPGPPADPAHRQRGRHRAALGRDPPPRGHQPHRAHGPGADRPRAGHALAPVHRRGRSHLAARLGGRDGDRPRAPSRPRSPTPGRSAWSARPPTPSWPARSGSSRPASTCRPGSRGRSSSPSARPGSRPSGCGPGCPTTSRPCPTRPRRPPCSTGWPAWPARARHLRPAGRRGGDQPPRSSS